MKPAPSNSPSKLKAVILHGKGSDHTDNWYGWVAAELEKEGWQVWIPDLPNWDQPDAKLGVDFLLSQDFDWNDSVVIGHSAGSVEILPLLEAFPKSVHIKAAILVATFTKQLTEANDWRSELRGLFTQPFNFEKIKQAASKFIVIHSDDDPICPIEQARQICRSLGGEFINLPQHQHFSVSRSGPRFKEFPELLEIIQTKVLQ